MGQIHVIIDADTKELVDQCEKFYRQHHPELNKIPLSKNKIINEISKFYLK